MLREIVIDTETTGLDAANGDRLIEIGCVEIINRIPTGREFHRYLNPEREVHADAAAVHGLNTHFLRDKPLFKAVAVEFLAFLGDAALVAHNAAFDLGFINAELARLARPPLAAERMVDTLLLARRKHPAGPNSLDALCKRYGVDNSARSKHGALLDALLLAAVYVELLGERQATLDLDASSLHERADGAGVGRALPRPVPLAPRIGPEVELAHQQFIKTLGPQALWLRCTTAAPLEG
jgi:DNA polymerase III subunit epsilon